MQTILVIDDQPDVAEMIDYVLSMEGYSVVSALGGEEGLDRARAFRPDLILCDIMMPGVNGYDVLDAVRDDPDLANIPFVFLTAKASPEDLRTGMKLGADDYLTKPFSADELVAAIKTRLEKYASIQGRFEQKLELLRQGISTILPHELRTPLSLILAHSSLLLEAYDSLEREDILDGITAISDAGTRLHRLLENLLIYVELGGDATLRLEHPFVPDAGKLVEESAIQCAKQYDRTGDLVMRVEHIPLNVHGFHLRKIAQEIVDNALKFSTKGLPVIVKTVYWDNEMQLIVSDQGRGFSQEELERGDAYIQFSRNKFEQQGGGMGLQVVKRIVKLYGGETEITSEPDLGTTVRITLPGK